MQRDEIVRNYFYRSFGIVRIWMIIAILLYASFGILDNFLIPINKYEIWIIRYFFSVPAMAFAVLATYFVTTNKILENLIIAFTAIAVLGLAAMITRLDPSEKAFHLYFVGFFAIMSWTQIIGLRHRAFVFMSVFIIAVYNIVAFGFQRLHDVELSELIFIELFLITFFIFGFYSSRVVELFVIDDYHKSKQSAEDKVELLQSRSELASANEFKRYLLQVLSNDILKSLGDLRQITIQNFSDDRLTKLATSKIELLDVLTTTTLIWSAAEDKTIVLLPKSVNVLSAVQDALQLIKTTSELKCLNIITKIDLGLSAYLRKNNFTVVMLNLLDILIRNTEKGSVEIVAIPNKGFIELNLYYSATDNKDLPAAIERIEQVIANNSFGFRVATQLAEMDHYSINFIASSTNARFQMTSAVSA